MRQKFLGYSFVEVRGSKVFKWKKIKCGPNGYKKTNIILWDHGKNGIAHRIAQTNFSSLYDTGHKSSRIESGNKSDNPLSK